MIPPTVPRSSAAVALDVTPPTVTSFVRRGWLRGVRIGRRWRIETASLEALVQRGSDAVANTEKSA